MTEKLVALKFLIYSTAQKYTNIANALLTNPQHVKIVRAFLPTR